jgi:hypothetical protein
MHGCKMTSSMESWKSEAQFIKSRCGFCGMDFDKWQDRIDHLAKEFRNGASMKDWKGCRGLDAHVAAHVTNAMPPYLIANESKSPFPFSATNSASMKVNYALSRYCEDHIWLKITFPQHHNLYLVQNDLEYLLPTDKTSAEGVFIPHHMGDVSLGGSASVSPTNVNGSNGSPQDQNTSSSITPIHPNPNATCWEILTLRLGRFARQHQEKNPDVPIADEMLQREARWILYDCDDPYDQTAADNPEWLGLFKKAHGIDTGPWPSVTNQHDILEDLGLGPKAQLDKSFNLSNFRCATQNAGTDQERAAFECSLSGSMNLTRTAMNTSSFEIPGLSSTTTSGSVHTPLTTSSFDLPDLNGPISELACTLPGGVCVGENGEIGYSVKSLSGAPNKQASFLPHSSSVIMPSLTEAECTKSGEPIWPTTTADAAGALSMDDFSMANWDELSSNFNVPTSTTSFSSSMPATTSMGMYMNFPTTTAGEAAQGTMRWDDSELMNFPLDMDLDMDLNDMITSGSDSNHRG